MDKLYYTPHEVAELLVCSSDTVLRRIHRGEIPALRVSDRVIRIPIAAFEGWRSGARPERRAIGIRRAPRRIAIGSDEAVPEPPALTTSRR